MSAFFLWPMIIPIIIPIIYCWKWKRDSLKHIWPILLSMMLIVVLYSTLLNIIDTPHTYYVGYTIAKFILFVFLPLGIFYWRSDNRDLKKILSGLGVRRKGAEKSLRLSIIFLPIMLISWYAITILLERSYPPSSISSGIIMFIESFTEEFFFRGIMFLYLWKFMDVRIAYITSMASFILMHPQYFWNLGIIPAIVQAILTTVIAHRSKNLAGPWVLHGTTRIFSLCMLPWFF